MEKNIKLSQFIQHDKNKSQPPIIHIHHESIIYSAETTISVLIFSDKICNLRHE
jgi:hypothetical protein